MTETLLNFLGDSGFGQLSLGSLAMIGIGLLFIWLAIVKKFEPLLLVPIGFGILIGNIPYNSSKLSLSVYDGPASPADIGYYTLDDAVEYEGEVLPPFTQIGEVGYASAFVRDMVRDGEAVMVHTKELMRFTGKVEPGVVVLPHGGHQIFVSAADAASPPDDDRYPIVIPPSRQNVWHASVMWLLFRGVEWGIFPPLIFLGVGALTDFGPLLANPKTILLGAAAQFGIFGALLGALLLGFDLNEAASIGIIGGADGPTAIFTCTMLAPHLLGPVALAAYSYMAMVPIIQPPIMRALTTRQERLIRMAPPRNVPPRTKIIFPVVGFLLTAFIANGALPLLGMLFLGNLLRESLVTERLAKTAQTALIDIVTILLGVTVGAKTQASNFLTPQTIGIFVMGIVAFTLATAAGVLCAKLMNVLSKEKINPLIGAAGVSAVPMAARVVQTVAHKEDPQNFLLMHAMGPNVAGVIGSAVAAGVLLSHLAN